MFELKYFFRATWQRPRGECSSTAIRALIRKLVAAESRKPLSDNKIAQLLEEQGVQVARRTIAKVPRVAHDPRPTNASGWYRWRTRMQVKNIVSLAPVV